MKRIVILLFASFIFTSLMLSASQPKDEKKKLEAGSATALPVFSEGIVYALPRTGINVTIKAQKTVYIPGPYAQYAERYLGIKGVKPAESENWEIIAISSETFSEADPLAVFKAMDSASTISLLGSGIIGGINSQSERDRLVVVENCFVAPSNIPLYSFTDLSSDDFFDVTVDATGNEKRELKTVEEKAREAADYLMRLRKKRSYNIINANDVVPEDGKGFEVFVNEVQRLEKEYVALFAGKTVVSEHDFAFSFIPGESNVKNEVLFRFSTEKGVLPKTDITGKPILLEVSKDDVVFSAIENLKKSDNPTAGESGVYYRMPCPANIKLSDGINVLYTRRLNVSQFGVVLPVPENLLQGDYQIQFDVESGTLKSVTEIKE